MNEIEILARQKFGDPNPSLGIKNKELRFGTHGSKKVDLETGLWIDFDTPEPYERGWLLDRDQRPVETKQRRLIIKKYDYVNADGELSYQVLRYYPKDFRQRRANGAWGLGDAVRVPYRLPEIIASDEVIIVEGEKDCDRLAAMGLTATWCGPAQWPDIAHYFKGKRVFIIPDNDLPGKEKAKKAFGVLSAFTEEIAICDICQNLPAKADVSDWLEKNDPATLIDLLHSFTRRTKIAATAFSGREMSAVEPRKWLYGKHLIRGYISATVSPGGVGKTTLELTEAIAMATGRNLLGITPERVKVWHYNLEDPRDELLRRTWAICKHFTIHHSELEGWLFLDSGRDCKMIVAEPEDGQIRPAIAANQVVEQMLKNDISVLQVDPLVKSHYAEENDNKQIDAVLDVFGDIAKRCSAAIDLVHHTRKPPSGFVAVAGDINTARGAGALSGAVRAARTVTPMSDKEAHGFGIEPSRRGWYVRVDDAKGNMSAPADEAVWFERQSIDLGQGDWVGILRDWTPPDPFDGLGIDLCHRILTQIGEGMEDEQRYLLQNKNNSRRWAGKLLINEGISEANSRAILKTWMESGLIYLDDYHNPIRRKPEDGLFVDLSKMPGNSRG